MCKLHRFILERIIYTVPISSEELYSIFELTVVVLRPGSLAFWFTLILIMSIVFNHIRKLFPAQNP